MSAQTLMVIALALLVEARVHVSWRPIPRKQDACLSHAACWVGFFSWKLNSLVPEATVSCNLFKNFNFSTSLLKKLKKEILLDWNLNLTLGWPCRGHSRSNSVDINSKILRIEYLWNNKKKLSYVFKILSITNEAISSKALLSIAKL